VIQGRKTFSPDNFVAARNEKKTGFIVAGLINNRVLLSQ